MKERCMYVPGSPRRDHQSTWPSATRLSSDQGPRVISSDVNEPPLELRVRLGVGHRNADLLHGDRVAGGVAVPVPGEADRATDDAEVGGVGQVLDAGAPSMTRSGATRGPCGWWRRSVLAPSTKSHSAPLECFICGSLPGSLGGAHLARRLGKKPGVRLSL